MSDVTTPAEMIVPTPLLMDVMRFLGQQPYDAVAPMIVQIQRQVKPHVPQPAAAEPEAKAD